jgi:FkbM family methyltransferase
MSSVLPFVRRLATAPGFRRLTTVTPLLRISFALRGTLVRTPLRFALNELRPGGVTASYGLREGGISIVVRHHTPDVLVLDEIFSQREYEFPSEVEQALAGWSRPLKIVDLGANIGLFGAFVLSRYPDARIVAVEADPANASLHERVIAANGREETWTLVPAYAATGTGTIRFAGGGYTLSHAGAAGDEATEIAAVDVFPYLEDADLIKIDIEGAEWPILGDPRFQALGAGAIVLEYHADGAPSTDPGSDAVRALEDAGYRTTYGAAKPAYAAGIVWGWRERHAQSSP